MNKDWLRGKTVVIVGASSGIGKYLAFNLILKYNCKILAISSNEREMVEFYDKLGEYIDNLTYYIFDACKETAWVDFSKSLETSGQSVDILINCLESLPKFKHFHEYTTKELNSVMSVNFYSSVLAVRYLLPYLKKSKQPAIINISCISSALAVGGTSIYSASRSALKSYTDVLSSELDGFYVGLVVLGNLGGDRYKNQEDRVSKELLVKALSPNVVSNKIIAGMQRKKQRIVVGVKTKILDYLSRFFPLKTNKIINKRQTTKFMSDK